eukprot:2137262-Rhodomonas_salina.3
MPKHGSKDWLKWRWFARLLIALLSTLSCLSDAAAGMPRTHLTHCGMPLSMQRICYGFPVQLRIRSSKSGSEVADGASRGRTGGYTAASDAAALLGHAAPDMRAAK